MKTLVILFTILIAGCANLSEMTDDERSTYLHRQEDRLYDRQENGKYNIRRDFFHFFFNCRCSKTTLLSHASSVAAIDEDLQNSPTKNS